VAFIVSLVTDALALDIAEALDTDDLVKAGVVRLGPLQENPVGNVTSVLIYENDPADLEGWAHTQKAESMSGFNTQQYFEIGGSELIERKFTIEMKVYLNRLNQGRAGAKALIDLVHGRVINAIRKSVRIPGLKDEFNETVITCRNGVRKSYMVLRGGPPSNWIGEGKLWLATTTHLP
jgi:hypothetical protein